MPDDRYAGFTPTERLAATAPAVSWWRAEGPDGPADLFLGADDLLARARALPGWAPFAPIHSGTDSQGQQYVVVPGALDESLTDLAWRLGPGPGAAFLWHVAAVLADLHERAGAHGLLHPDFIGIDAEGFLSIRPALAFAFPRDPDPTASAQQSDCLQFGTLVDTIANSEVSDEGISLLLDGLRQPRARIRLAPARAIRQTLTAISAQKPDWEQQLVEALGEGWSLDQDYRPALPITPPRSAVRPTPTPTPAPAPAQIILPTPTPAVEQDDDDTVELSFDNPRAVAKVTLPPPPMIIEAGDGDDDEDLPIVIEEEEPPEDIDEIDAEAEALFNRLIADESEADEPTVAEEDLVEPDAFDEIAAPEPAIADEAEPAADAPAAQEEPEEIEEPAVAEEPEPVADVPEEPEPEEPDAPEALEPVVETVSAPVVADAPAVAEEPEPVADTPVVAEEAELLKEPEPAAEAPAVEEEHEEPEPVVADEAAVEEEPEALEAPEPVADAPSAQDEPEEIEEPVVAEDEAELLEEPEPVADVPEELEEPEVVQEPEPEPEPEPEEADVPEAIEAVVEGVAEDELELLEEPEPVVADAPAVADEPEPVADTPVVVAEPVSVVVIDAPAAEDEPELLEEAVSVVVIDAPAAEDEAELLEEPEPVVADEPEAVEVEESAEPSAAEVMFEEDDAEDLDEYPTMITTPLEAELLRDVMPVVVLAPEEPEEEHFLSQIAEAPVLVEEDAFDDDLPSRITLPGEIGLVRDVIPAEALAEPERVAPKPAPVAVEPPSVVRQTRMRPPRVEPEPEPEPEPAPVVVAEPEPEREMMSSRRGEGEPLWGGIAGVTNRTDREKELGLGKWTEPARSSEEIRQSLSTRQPRELDLTVERPTWPLYAAAALAMMAAVGWLWQWGLGGSSEEVASAPVALAEVSDVVEATPDIEAIRIEVVHGEDGPLTYDGILYGPTPIDVPLPEDDVERTMCVADRCRGVTRSQLTASGRAYFFDRRPE